MTSSKFTELCNHHHNPTLEHFVTPKKSLMPIFSFRDFQKRKGRRTNNKFANTESPDFQNCEALKTISLKLPPMLKCFGNMFNE